MNAPGRAATPQRPAHLGRPRGSELSDERLLAAIRAGDEAAFEALVARHRGPVLGFCRRLLGSTEDAEDVLQEVLVAAHAAILADRREISVRPWLHRIARNRCLNHLRRRADEPRESMDDHPHRNGISTAEQVRDREELRALLGDLDELPESQRTALLLRRLGGLSYAEIAAATGATVPAVRSRLVRAHLALGARRTLRSGAGALAPVGALLEWLRSRLAGAIGAPGPGGGGAAGTAGAGAGAGLAAKLPAMLASGVLLGAGAIATQDRAPGEPGRAAGVAGDGANPAATRATDRREDTAVRLLAAARSARRASGAPAGGALRSPARPAPGPDRPEGGPAPSGPLGGGTEQPADRESAGQEAPDRPATPTDEDRSQRDPGAGDRLGTPSDEPTRLDAPGDDARAVGGDDRPAADRNSDEPPQPEASPPPPADRVGEGGTSDGDAGDGAGGRLPDAAPPRSDLSGD